MIDEDDVGFVIDLKTMTCTFDGGFVCPITSILDEDGEETLDAEEAIYVVVKVPPECRLVTVDLRMLRDEWISPPVH